MNHPRIDRSACWILLGNCLIGSCLSDWRQLYTFILWEYSSAYSLPCTSLNMITHVTCEPLRNAEPVTSPPFSRIHYQENKASPILEKSSYACWSRSISELRIAWPPCRLNLFRAYYASSTPLMHTWPVMITGWAILSRSSGEIIFHHSGVSAGNHGESCSRDPARISMLEPCFCFFILILNVFIMLLTADIFEEFCVSKRLILMVSMSKAICLLIECVFRYLNWSLRSAPLWLWYILIYTVDVVNFCYWFLFPMFMAKLQVWLSARSAVYLPCVCHDSELR